SRPLTATLLALPPVSPGQLDCPGDADPQPGDDMRFARAGMQRERGTIERQAVMLIANPKRFRQLARTRAQRSLVMQSAPAPHRRNAVGRLQRPDQYRARGAFLLADEIDAPVHAVGAIDVAKAWRADNHFVARRRPTERMRGRIGVMIGLDLDDDAADTVYQQRRADQIGGDLVHAAGKERALARAA